jgi:outer membrane autotransporter protein
MTRESAGVSALATNAFLHEGMTKRGCRVCDSPSFFIYGYPVVLSGYIVSFPTSGMFPRKPVAGFYESHDSFIGHGIIQHDGNPQFVVHVIGRIDAGNLVEAVRLFRPDFYIEDINLFGIVVFVENRACYAHNQGEPFSIKGMAERPIGRIPFRTAPRKIRPDLELIQDVLDKAVCLRGSEQDIVAAEGGDALQVETVTGSHTWALDLNYDDHSQSDMIYVVNGTSDTQTLVVKNLTDLNSQMSDGDAVRFATVKYAGGGFQEGTTYYVTNGLYNDALTVDYRTISEDPDADENYDDGNKPSQATVASLYGGDDATNIYLVKTANAELNIGALAPAKSRDIVWRYVTDMDTFTNRTGQSVYFTPDADQGGWVRLRYRNLGVDGVGEVDGNTYELGYTTVSRQNDERKHRFSASVSYGKESGSWEGYGGDLDIRDFTVSLFDTHEYYPGKEKMAEKPAWKQGTHSYWDNYFKYHHVKTDYSAIDHHTGLQYDGNYDENVYSLSTEYGRVNKLNERWSLVPQAQLQLSYLGGYDYTDSLGLKVDGDHDWSLIGRLGFDLVHKLDAKQDNKLYLKASLLHEFFDGNDVTTRYDSDRYVNSGDQSGTWGVVGLGYSSKIGDKQYFYLDAERYLGNDFSRTYDIRAGVNWKF